MTNQNLLNQLVELTGNTCNAFTIALYKVCPDDKALVLRHHVSLSSNFDPKLEITSEVMSRLNKEMPSIKLITPSIFTSPAKK